MNSITKTTHVKGRREMIAKIMMLLIILAVLTPSCFAHIPITGEGYGLDDAVVINDPLKSWVIYTEFKDARPLYYKFDLSADDLLKAGLLTVDKEFVPDLTILGLGLPSDFDESFKDEFEIPEGYGLLHIHGEAQEHKEYEPFTPSSYYQVLSVEFTVNETGTYYLIVDSAKGSGKVGVVIGYRESFTVLEWLKVPFDVAFVHHWEGQDYLFILLPLILIFFGGLLLNCHYFKINLDWSKALAFMGSLTYFGSAIIILVQMIIGLIGATYDSLVLVTPFFILLPALLGYSILRKVLKPELSNWQKVRLFLYGLIGLIFWAGYLLGPVLVMISALKPIKRTP